MSSTDPCIQNVRFINWQRENLSDDISSQVAANPMNVSVPPLSEFYIERILKI